jgi:hypothetical protein
MPPSPASMSSGGSPTTVGRLTDIVDALVESL